MQAPPCCAAAEAGEALAPSSAAHYYYSCPLLLQLLLLHFFLINEGLIKRGEAETVGMIIVLFLSVLLFRIGRGDRPPAFGGADAVAVLRPPRTRCRRKHAVSGAKPTRGRRFGCKTDVNSASTHPPTLPTIKSNKKKTNSNKTTTKTNWRTKHSHQHRRREDQKREEQERRRRRQTYRPTHGLG